MPAAPAAGVATDGSDNVGGGGTDDVPDDDAPSAVELERAFRADIRARLSTLTVPELKQLCRDNHLRLGGNRAVLLARVGDWLATQDLLFSDDKRGAAPAIDPGDQGCLEVETFGINAASQYRDDRDPADKRPQAERDVARLLEAQQRELDTLKSAFDHRCTRWLLLLPGGPATVTAAARADVPRPRRQLSSEWLNKKGHLAEYIGLPGPFAKACKILLALLPLEIGAECQSSWQGELLTPLDCALVTKMWLHTGKTMGMLATDVDVPLATLQDVIREWLPRWGAAAKTLLRLWLSYDYVAASMPAGDGVGDVQAELNGAPVSGMPDGKDFETHRWNRNPLLRRLTYSNKSHGAALIIVAWALPTRQIVLVTDVFLGLVSEANNLVQAHEPYWLRVVFGVGTFIVADKVIWGTVLLLLLLLSSSSSSSSLILSAVISNTLIVGITQYYGSILSACSLRWSCCCRLSSSSSSSSLLVVVVWL